MFVSLISRAQSFRSPGLPILVFPALNICLAMQPISNFFFSWFLGLSLCSFLREMSAGLQLCRSELLFQNSRVSAPEVLTAFVALYANVCLFILGSKVQATVFGQTSRLIEDKLLKESCQQMYVMLTSCSFFPWILVPLVLCVLVALWCCHKIVFFILFRLYILSLQEGSLIQAAFFIGSSRNLCHLHGLKSHYTTNVFLSSSQSILDFFFSQRLQS